MVTRVFLALSRAGLTLSPSKGSEGSLRSSCECDASIGGGKYCSPDESAEFIQFLHHQLTVGTSGEQNIKSR
jgi:hypothetical protein